MAFSTQSFAPKSERIARGNDRHPRGAKRNWLCSTRSARRYGSS